MGIKELFFPSSPRNRIHPKDPYWNGKKKGFVIAVTSVFVILQSLFLANLSYLNGALWKDGEKVHNLKMLMIDYDQGIVGESLRTAYSALQADSFPALVEKTSTEYADPAALQHAVFVGNYWGAIYAHAGASERLAAALSGGDAATNYDNTKTITYIMNGARYPTVTQGYIQADSETLIAATRVVYNSINGSAAMQYVSTLNDNSAASLVLLNPIASSHIDIKPTTQGPRVIYNTVSVVFPIILQFFFLMGVNGISSLFQLYSHLPLLNNGIIRFVLSTIYTFVGSLCTSAYIYAFREAWEISTGQFFLMWATYWLYMHINFLVMDTATAFIPLSFISFFVVTWIVLNITSTLIPFELSPGFYRWGYALPSHETYQVLIQIWSNGGYQRLGQALPILFAWEVAMLPLAVLGLHYRCEAAARAYQTAEQEKEALKAGAREEALSQTTTRNDSTSTAAAAAAEAEAANTVAIREETQQQYYPAPPIPFQNTLRRAASGV